MDDSKIYGELIPCGGGDTIPLLKRKLVVGRRPNCDVTLRFANVSSHHCELELLNGYWFVRDLGSSNGIRVNGRRCDQKWVFPGDVLSVSRHKYEMTYQAFGERPVEEEENPFSKSLMEKAGLVQSERPRRDRDTIEEVPATEDDVAMQWLMGEE